MGALDGVFEMLEKDVRAQIAKYKTELTEIRLRTGCPVQIIAPGRDILAGAPVKAEDLSNILYRMLKFSMYAHEDELRQGYFTIDGGCRIGVCGRFAIRQGRIEGITYLGSICIRIARELIGCAEGIVGAMATTALPKSTLIISRPGLGKTTLLRDATRLLSCSGFKVGLADERGELAACMSGVPTLNVGIRTDVIDGMPKSLAISRLVRTMSPDVIVTDELGGEDEAGAVLEARRCGVSVLASAHGCNIESALSRGILHELDEAGAFEMAVLLDGKPGCIAEIRDL